MFMYYNLIEYLWAHSKHYVWAASVRSVWTEAGWVSEYKAWLPARSDGTYGEE